MKHYLLAIIIAIISTSAYGQNLQPKQDSKGKWGVTDESGKWVVKPKYNAISEFVKVGNNSYATVDLGGNIGLINGKGKELIKPEYQQTSSITSLGA